jgi:hypothetical protein
VQPWRSQVFTFQQFTTVTLGLSLPGRSVLPCSSICVLQKQI